MDRFQRIMFSKCFVVVLLLLSASSYFVSSEELELEAVAITSEENDLPSLETNDLLETETLELDKEAELLDLESSEVVETVTSEEDTGADNSSVSTTDTANSTVLVACRPRLETDSHVVELVNATGLLSLLENDVNVTSRRSPAQCVAIMFYASWCPFSCLAAPHFNALPRAFPDIKVVAMDSMKHYSLNTQFGIVGVPTILLFHNGRPTARFNESEFTLKMFSQFISKYTGLEPIGLLNVTSADFAGPILSVAEKETDHWLILSWTFVSTCGLYFLVQSTFWRSLVESMKNVWREADEAHHEHGD